MGKVNNHYLKYTHTIAVYKCLYTHTQDEDTPLHCAAMKGHLDTVKELVKAGARLLRNKVSVHIIIYTCIYKYICIYRYICIYTCIYRYICTVCVVGLVLVSYMIRGVRKDVLAWS